MTTIGKVFPKPAPPKPERESRGKKAETADEDVSGEENASDAVR